ncbi:GNAT family N-acetyltransferase [uncultured Cohaesibacter sp.]|uniref:GNAT family N-acetyltransferase n=1 Tax=uncultured Cohaesibacter sp. TaxID=1002546 RepID=UPI002AAB3462|nr:GNAT family N-acetyltransferase [uncultured Cohaesibacter sp.]
MSYALIRSATDEDGPAIGKLIASVFADYENCHFVDEEYPELEHPSSYYAAMGGQIWVAEQDGVIVGSLAVAQSLTPGLFELHKVYVAKEARGQGLAWSMFNLATDLVDKREGKAIRLWSDTRFLEGHAFYEKIGFQKVPVERFLGDVSESWEFGFRLDAKDVD